MTTFFAVLGVVAWIAAPIALIVLIIKAIAKKSTKKSLIIWLSLSLAGLGFFVLSYLTAPSTWCEHEYRLVEEKAATCTVDGEITYHCDLCDTPNNKKQTQAKPHKSKPYPVGDIARADMGGVTPSNTDENKKD